jgi:glycosyltransferase involved in cell wall biosynthesis
VRKVLVMTPDRVGGAMSVPAIRAAAIARELSDEFDLTLIDGREGAPEDIRGFDAVVAQRLPFPTMRALARSRAQVVYDLYVPFAVEHVSMLAAEQRTPAERLFSEWARAAQRYALATGNAFVCPSERQRDLWLGTLARLRRLDVARFRADPMLRNLVDVVPLGLESHPPRPGPALKGVLVQPTDKVLLWAGGIWNWLDPLTPIRAVRRLCRSDVKLVFLGVRHPNVDPPAMTRRAVDLAGELGLLDRVVFFRDGWVPYEERGAFLLDADVGVSAHFDSLETRFAFRTRLLDHFWAGLPTVTTRGDVLADVVERHGVGRAVPADDPEAYADAVEELLESSPPVERYEPVRAELSWSRVVEPLRRLLRVPGEAVRPPLGLEDWILRARISLALGGSVRRKVLRR